MGLPIYNYVARPKMLERGMVAEQMIDGWIHNEWIGESSSDRVSCNYRRQGVAEMRMGMDIWTDRIWHRALSFHLSLLPPSLLTLHSEQVMKLPYWLFVCISFSPFLCALVVVMPPPAASDISDVCSTMKTQFQMLITIYSSKRMNHDQITNKTVRLICLERQDKGEEQQEPSAGTIIYG